MKDVHSKKLMFSVIWFSPHYQKLLGEEGQDVVCVYMTQRVSLLVLQKDVSL